MIIIPLASHTMGEKDMSTISSFDIYQALIALIEVIRN